MTKKSKDITKSLEKGELKELLKDNEARKDSVLIYGKDENLYVMNIKLFSDFIKSKDKDEVFEKATFLSMEAAIDFIMEDYDLELKDLTLKFMDGDEIKEILINIGLKNVWEKIKENLTDEAKSIKEKIISLKALKHEHTGLIF